MAGGMVHFVVMIVAAQTLLGRDYYPALGYAATQLCSLGGLGGSQSEVEKYGLVLA